MQNYPQSPLSSRHLLRRAMLYLVFLVLASYGMLYFSLKFYHPGFGATDYDSYQKMYQDPLNFDVAPSPFIYRQLGAVITNLIINFGPTYSGRLTFQGPNRNVFIGAIFSNYIALLITACFVCLVIDLRLSCKKPEIALLGGLLCLLSFFCQFTVLTGLQEGWSWCLIAGSYFAYLERRSILMFVLLALSVWQREIVFVVLASIVIADTLWFPAAISRRYRIWTVLCAVLAAMAYICIRTLVLPRDGYESQLRVSNAVSNLLSAIHFDRSFVDQALTSQNLLGMLLLTLLIGRWVAWKREVKFEPNTVRMASHALLAAGTLYALSIATGVGNNTGRIVGMTAPLVAIATAVAISDGLAKLGHVRR